MDSSWVDIRRKVSLRELTLRCTLTSNGMTLKFTTKQMKSFSFIEPNKKKGKKSLLRKPVTRNGYANGVVVKKKKKLVLNVTQSESIHRKELLMNSFLTLTSAIDPHALKYHRFCCQCVSVCVCVCVCVRGVFNALTCTHSPDLFLINDRSTQCNCADAD